MKLEIEVMQVVKRSKDVKSVRFIRPKGFNYLPGQWAFIALGNQNEQKTKPLSLSSSPTENFLEVTKKLTGHEFSDAFDALKIGDIATIDGPYGNLIFLGEYDEICMLCGGIGITPLRSMIRYSADKNLNASIILLYSNRFEDDITFKDEFYDIQKMNSNFRMILTITRPSQAWKGFKGRINQEMIEKTVPNYVGRVFYTCGPKPMVDAMVALLRKISIAEEQIKYEYFTGYLGAPSNKT